MSAVVSCLVTVMLVGCGSNALQQPTYKTNGEVRLNGNPVAGATVVFQPVDKSKFKWDEQPQGITDADGKYSLFTYSSNDGAPAGAYRVGIALLQAASEDGGDQVKREKLATKVPQKYSDPGSSGLTATVDSASTVVPTFELTGK